MKKSEHGVESIINSLRNSKSDMSSIISLWEQVDKIICTDKKVNSEYYKEKALNEFNAFDNP
jgi:hypothetical protein